MKLTDEERAVLIGQCIGTLFLLTMAAVLFWLNLKDAL